MRPTKLSITHKFRSDHENLGNLGIIFLRSVYIAAMLYAAIRILEGLIIIALQVRPLGSLRVVSLHRPMLQRRTFHVLEFLAFLFWLHLMLSLFGLLTQLIATTEAALNGVVSPNRRYSVNGIPAVWA
jgi:hypothetical protein